MLNALKADESEQQGLEWVKKNYPDVWAELEKIGTAYNGKYRVRQFAQYETIEEVLVQHKASQADDSMVH